MSKVIVADTGPLISWARAGQLPLLRILLPELIVPPAVVEELRQPGRPGGELLSQAGWLRVHELPASLVLGDFPTVLGSGEVQAIALAVHLKAEYTVLDDGRAGLEARRRGLEVLRSLRLLAQAKHLGLVPRVAPILEQFVRQGFWLSDVTRVQFLRAVEEEG